MSHVEDWASKRLNTLSGLLKREVRPTDVSDDRLADVVEHLSQDTVWVPYERGVTQQLMAQPLERAARPRRATFRGAMGLIAGTAVVPGNSADDGLYIPLIDQMRETLAPCGMVYVGDAKMSALATRAHIQATDNIYLTPLALIGQVPADLYAWVEAALRGKVKLSTLYAVPAQDGDKPTVLGRGYEVAREQSGQDTTGAKVTWSERVLVVYSPQHAAAQEQGLQQRVTRALAELQALTPPPGRGRRQFTDESLLRSQAQVILKRLRVDGLKVAQPFGPPRAFRGHHLSLQD